MKVLFVCVENSNRSQMAEAFARILGGSNIEAFSAGSKPSGVVNPKAIASMQEIGYDLCTHKSKSLDDIPNLHFDFVATMGCGDSCESVSGNKKVDWPIPDPKYLDAKQFGEVRDQVREQVRLQLQKMGISTINGG